MAGFSMNGGVTPLRAKSVSEYFTTLCKRTGVDAHLHLLRSYAATQMGANNVSPVTIAERLGDSVSTAMDRYVSSTTQAARDAAAAIGRPLLSPAQWASPANEGPLPHLTLVRS